MTNLNRLFSGGCIKAINNNYECFEGLAIGTKVQYCKIIDSFLSEYKATELNLHRFLDLCKYSNAKYNTAKSALLKYFAYYNIAIANRPKSLATRKSQKDISYTKKDILFAIDCEANIAYKNAYLLMYKYLLRSDTLLSLQVHNGIIFGKVKGYKDIQPFENISLKEFESIVSILNVDSSTLRKRIAKIRKENNLGIGFSIRTFRDVGIQEQIKNNNLQKIKEATKHKSYDGLNYYTKL